MTDQTEQTDHTDQTNHTEQTDESLSLVNSVEPAYGPTGDGGYNTPYSVTVFYRESEIFQVAVAALSEQCQAIPIIDGADLSILAEVCEHPSPELIIFSDAYTPEHIKAYFKRGFQKIHVFCGESSRSEKASIVDSSIVNSSTVETSTITELSKIDSRIELFSLADLSDHVKLISNLTTMYIMDLITCGVYPNHKSFIRTITHERGTELIRYLSRTTKSPKEIGATLIRLATQYNGYERAEELCSRWRGITEERNLLAQERVNSSPIINDILYIYYGDLRNDIFAVLSRPIAAKYIVLWSVVVDENNKTIHVNVLTGSKWTTEDKTVADLLAPFGDVINSGQITECVLTDKKFIPFL